MTSARMVEAVKVRVSNAITCLESTKPRTAEKRRHDNGPVAPINSGKTMKGIDKVRSCKEEVFTKRITAQNTIIAPAGHMWRCGACAWEHDNRHTLQEHLSSAHALPPFGCATCDFAALQRKVIEH